MNQGPLKFERSEGTSMRPTQMLKVSCSWNFPIRSRMAAWPVILALASAPAAVALPNVPTKSACQATYSWTCPLKRTSTSEPITKPFSFLALAGSLDLTWLSRRNQMAGGSIFLCEALGTSVDTAGVVSAGAAVTTGGATTGGAGGGGGGRSAGGGGGGGGASWASTGRACKQVASTPASNALVIAPVLMVNM